MSLATVTGGHRSKYIEQLEQLAIFASERRVAELSALAILLRRPILATSRRPPTVRCHVAESYTQRFMDEQIGDGNAFAIPDLWESSTFANLDERTDSIALGFEPLSTPSSPKNS